MRISIGLINCLASGILMTSCVSNQNLWTDDVYHMRTAELPEGESLADETGYASFKERMESSSEPVENTYYETAQYPQYYGFYNSYDPVFWGTYPLNYYPSTTLFFGQGIPGFNQDLSWYGSYGYPYYSSYSNYDPFYSIYGYNPYYGFGNFNQGFGFFNNGLGFNYNSGYYSSNYSNGNGSGNSGNTNYHEGPRGSLAGYSNSANRLGLSTIKSSEITTNYEALNRPTIIGNFIMSEEVDNTTNAENGISISSYTNNNRTDNAGYTPKEQRLQYNNSIDYNYTSFGNTTRGTFNISGNSETRGTNRSVNVQSSPSRIDVIQPTRGGGTVRQVPSGRRN